MHDGGGVVLADRPPAFRTPRPAWISVVRCAIEGHFRIVVLDRRLFAAPRRIGCGARWPSRDALSRGDLSGFRPIPRARGAPENPRLGRLKGRAVMQTLIQLIVMLSIVGIVVAIGLDATLDDLLSVLRHPLVLGRAVLAVNVIVPQRARSPGPAVARG
jgi:hypothetical protein